MRIGQNQVDTMSSVNSTASGYRGSKRASKRAACDRCREQKSRCPREGQGGKSDSERCSRCVKAGTICHFSISLRAGRPSASKSKSLSKRTESSSSDQASRETTSSDQTAPWDVLTQEPRDYNHNPANQDDDLLFLSPNGSEIWMRGALGDEPIEASSQSTTLAGDVSHMPKPLEPYFTRDFTNIFNGEHVDFLNQPQPFDTTLRAAEGDVSPMNIDPFVRNYNWSLNNTVYPLRGFSSSHTTSLGESPTSTLPTTPQTRTSELSRWTTGESRKKSRTNSDEVPADPARPVHSQVKPRGRAEWEGSSRLQSMTPKSAPSNSEDGVQESPPAYSSSATQDIQHRRMRELSELGLIVYSQVGEATSRDEANPLALNIPNNLAVMVLESSVKFLSLLTSLYPSRPPPCVPEDAQTSSSSDEDISTTANNKSQGLHQLKHSNSNDTSNSDDSSPQSIDMTEVFALLTCYIRVLHLHYLLYSRISDFITTQSQSGAPLPAVFPGVQAGSVLLDTFAKFQVKLLIQISTHVLGEIEMALGLPDGYRISKRNSQRQGIFEGSVSVQFIEMTMKEKGKSGLGMDRGEFTSIRDHLGRLRQLLKGTINP